MPLSYQQIIAEVDEKYPNALSTVSKLRKINLIERELFRTIYKKKTSMMMDIEAGQPLYPLQFNKSKIIHVIVDGKRYDYEEIDNEEAEPPFLYTYQNSIGIYPKPERDIDAGMFIFHYEEPVEPTESTINSLPSFDPDFPMVLVYGVCKHIAEMYRDYDIASGFANQYNAAVEEFKGANPEPELPPMRVE